MAHIYLRALSCQETQEPVDEPQLLGILPDPTPTQPYRERTVPIFYPLRMDKGETFQIDQRIEFDTWIRIELWERDQVGRDNRIGAVTVPATDTGEHLTMLFSGPELGSAQSALYSISYDVAAEDAFEYPYSIRLVTLHCHDAQEGTDEVFLTVSNREVWAQSHMDNRVTATVDRTESFRDIVQVELWERDSGRSDLFGTLRIDVRGGGVELDRDLTHEFRFSKSSLDDARYTLTYRIERP